MAVLLTVRALVGPYLEAAEKIGWKWLGDGEVLVTRFGEDVIGTLVFEVREVGKEEGASGSGGKGKSKGKAKGRRKGVLRGWTVKLRFRGKTVGRGLIEDGVRILVEERGCETVEWAEDHARELPALPPSHQFLEPRIF